MGPASSVIIPGSAKRVNVHGRLVFARILDHRLNVNGPADLILCGVDPARDEEYIKKTAGLTGKGRWAQFPN